MRFFATLGLLLAASTGFAQQPTPADTGKSTLIFAPGAKEPTGKPSPTPQGADKPAQIIDQFFLSLKGNQVDAAYDALVKDTIIADRKEDVTALKAKTKQAMEAYGPIAGYEIIDEELVGTALFRRTCLSINSDLPLRWRFYFYKSDGAWKLVDLRVDDGLVELFEDAARKK